MILCIGEILADMVGESEGDSLALHAYCGGAPFNCAVNAKQAGAKVGFVGRVGDGAVRSLITWTSRRMRSAAPRWRS